MVPFIAFKAIPLIERLALHELIDPRIEDSYDPFEVYHMARTAFLCVQTNPEMRPSMAEVMHYHLFPLITENYLKSRLVCASPVMMP